jgi:hypothetical protein
MPATYTTIDFGFVSAGTTVNRVFIAVGREVAQADPFLILWVKTGYNTGPSAASLSLNGVLLSRIYPRPWTGSHNYIDFEADSYIVPRSLLAPRLSPFLQVGINTLSITAQPGGFDYLWATNGLLLTQ